LVFSKPFEMKKVQNEVFRAELI